MQRLDGAPMFNVPNGSLIITGGRFEAHFPDVFKDPGKVIQKSFKDIYAADALYDANDVLEPPKCHPNTRTAILQKLARWTHNLGARSHILWIYGPAGSGKSAIGRSLAQLMEEEGSLGASFFFLRTSSSRNHEKLFVSTIAYQLAFSIPQLQPYIAQTVERNPLVFRQSLEKQFKQLIVDPMVAFSRISRESDPTAHLVIVDGLDECENPEAQSLILRTISDALPHLSDLSRRLKFLILSRREYQIESTFAQPKIKHRTASIDLMHDLNTLDDIRIFLHDKFVNIKRLHPLKANIDNLWPGEDAIEHLMRKSGGTFIYPHVVMRYIESSHDRPERRLQVILDLAPTSDKPYADLDDLFRHILLSVRRERHSFTKTLSILVAIGTRYGHDIPRIGFTKYGNRTRFMETILGLDPGELKLHLIDLQSLVKVDDSKPHPVFEFLHTSFPDFLLDPDRSGEFAVNMAEAYRDIAIGALRVLSRANFVHLREEYYDILKEEPASQVLSYPSPYNPTYNQRMTRRIDTNWELQQAHFDILFWSCSKALPSQDLKQAMRDYNSAHVYDLITAKSYGDQHLQSWDFASDVITNFFKCIDNRNTFRDNGVAIYHLDRFDASLKSQFAGFHRDHIVVALTLLVCITDHLSEWRTNTTYHVIWDAMTPLFCPLPSIVDSEYTRLHGSTERGVLCQRCGLETDATFTLPLANPPLCDFQCLGNFERCFLDRLKGAVSSGNEEKLGLLMELRSFIVNKERSGPYHVTHASVTSIAIRFLGFVCAPRDSTVADTPIEKIHECFLPPLIGLILWLMYDKSRGLDGGGHYYPPKKEPWPDPDNLEEFLQQHFLRPLAGREAPWQFKSIQSILHDNLGRLINEYYFMKNPPEEINQQVPCLVNRTSIATIWSPFGFEMVEENANHMRSMGRLTEPSNNRKRPFADSVESDDGMPEMNSRQRARTG